jgi:hypothetical protein
MKTHSIRIPISINGRDGEAGSINLTKIASLVVSGTQQANTSKKPQDYLLVPDMKSYAPIRRMVVIVPAGELDERRLGLEIGKIALPGRMDIVFLALAFDPETDKALRRRLVSLTSFVEDRQIRASTRLAFRESWVQAVKEIWQEGDLLVCIQGHRTASSLLARTELGQHLVSALGVPVYVLTAVQLSNEPIKWNHWREMLVWLSAIAVMVLFGFLQAFIVRNLQDSVSTSVLILSVVLEVLVLWKLNSLG